MLLNLEIDVVEVYCEHHEDILLKHNDGMYSGIQVKTRGGSQPIWSSSDEEVIKAVAKFVTLDGKFPNQFRLFKFLTNHPLNNGQSAQSLRYILSNVRAVESFGDTQNAVKIFIRKVAVASGKDTEVVFGVLLKVEVDDTLPKLSEIELRVVADLELVWPKASELTFSAVRTAVRILADECSRASTLAHQDDLPLYIKALYSASDVEIEARISNKRFDQSRVLTILDQMEVGLALLESPSSDLPMPGSGDDNLLRKKLDAGGLSLITYNSAIELKGSAEFLAFTWINRLGEQEGMKRYGHIRKLIQRDAGAAYDATKVIVDGHPEMLPTFGIKMLEELRGKIREERRNGRTSFDCTDEHLEGFAFLLTSECKVGWSINWPMEPQ